MFVPVDRSDSFQKVKDFISDALGQNTIKAVANVPASSITLYSTVTGEKELPSAGTISDHEIGNDAIIFVVFDGEKIDVEGPAGVVAVAEKPAE